MNSIAFAYCMPYDTKNKKHTPKFQLLWMYL